MEARVRSQETAPRRRLDGAGRAISVSDGDSEGHHEPMSHDAGGTSGARRRWWRRPVSLLVLAVCLVLAALPVALHWPGKSRDPAAPHVRAAHRAWSERRLDEAAAELEQAQQNREPAALVDRLWGLVYASAGRTDDALPRLRRAWDQPGGAAHQPDPEVAEALARIAMERFELADAIAVLDLWARDVATDPKPLVWRAKLERRIGLEAPVIIGRFQEALHRDPTNDEARLGLADMLYREGRYVDSAELYTDYAARHPDDPAGHAGLAMAARARGEVDQAVSALDRVLALTPDDPLALKERAAIDVLQGHPDAALRRLDRAIAADPFDPELRYQRSRVLSQLGRRDLAEADLRHSEQLRLEHAEMTRISAELIAHPADNVLRCRAARWMLAHGRSEEGVQWARMVLRDQPDHPQANRLLADYHRSRGEVGLANFYQVHASPAPASAGGSPVEHKSPSSIPLAP
jgi:tetratricopeptide (TPR) repeat protein